MSLNIPKCSQMTVTKKKSPLSHAYKINDVGITLVNTFKYLGIEISRDLRRSAYTQNIVSSASWLLQQCLKHCTSKTKLVDYTSLVRPLLEYGDVVWDQHTKTDTDKLEKVQKRALRFIFNAYGRQVSLSDLRSRSGLPTLEERCKLHRLKMLYTIVNG